LQTSENWAAEAGFNPHVHVSASLQAFAMAPTVVWTRALHSASAFTGLPQTSKVWELFGGLYWMMSFGP
jgi:hypothetical protein